MVDYTKRCSPETPISIMTTPPILVHESKCCNFQLILWENKGLVYDSVISKSSPTCKLCIKLWQYLGTQEVVIPYRITQHLFAWMTNSAWTFESQGIVAGKE